LNYILALCILNLSSNVEGALNTGKYEYYSNRALLSKYEKVFAPTLSPSKKDLEDFYFENDFDDDTYSYENTF
jgi:hypothetical protein